MPTEHGTLSDSDSQYIKRAAVMQIAASIIAETPSVKDPMDANDEKNVRHWMSRVRQLARVITEEYDEPQSG